MGITSSSSLGKYLVAHGDCVSDEFFDAEYAYTIRRTRELRMFIVDIIVVGRAGLFFTQTLSILFSINFIVIMIIIINRRKSCAAAEYRVWYWCADHVVHKRNTINYCSPLPIPTTRRIKYVSGKTAIGGADGGDGVVEEERLKTSAGRTDGRVVALSCRGSAAGHAESGKMIFRSRYKLK